MLDIFSCPYFYQFLSSHFFFKSFSCFLFSFGPYYLISYSSEGMMSYVYVFLLFVMCLWFVLKQELWSGCVPWACLPGMLLFSELSFSCNDRILYLISVLPFSFAIYFSERLGKAVIWSNSPHRAPSSVSLWYEETWYPAWGLPHCSAPGFPRASVSIISFPHQQCDPTPNISVSQTSDPGLERSWWSHSLPREAALLPPCSGWLS